nr:hypothetical protein [uncultured Prevotella sp.]
MAASAERYCGGEQIKKSQLCCVGTYRQPFRAQAPLPIDNSLYHCGHSLNANGGHKISAITLMGISPEVILSEVK